MKILNCFCLSAALILVGTKTLTLKSAEGKEKLENIVCKNLKKGAISGPIFEKLSDQELGHLSQTCKPMKAILDKELERRKREFWLSHIANAVNVDCHSQIYNFPNNETFQKYVLDMIEEVSKKDPKKWISLDLSDNNLGTNEEFLKTLIVAVTTKVNELHIDIAKLTLNSNRLTMLPENIFKNLANLHTLKIMNNRLVTLPDTIFNNLPNLQQLWLMNNLLEVLPDTIFNNLPNLQQLFLNINQLRSLPDTIFKNLTNLKTLDLSGNRLPKKTNQELHISETVKIRWD